MNERNTSYVGVLFLGPQENTFLEKITDATSRELEGIARIVGFISRIKEVIVGLYSSPRRLLEVTSKICCLFKDL